MKQETSMHTLNQIIARCWADAAFKTQLEKDPATTLQMLGVDVPAGVQLRVLSDTAQVRHLVIPASPAGLSDEALEALAGGYVLDERVVDAVAKGNLKNIAGAPSHLPNPIYWGKLPWLR